MVAVWGKHHTLHSQPEAKLAAISLAISVYTGAWPTGSSWEADLQEHSNTQRVKCLGLFSPAIHNGQKWEINHELDKQ